MGAQRVIDPDRLDADRAAFIASWPSFVETAPLDALRAADFARLDEQEHVYLDYTGGGLYGASQVRAHAEFMTGNIFGNPHSGNPASLDMTDHVEATRREVLRYFNASPDEYTVVFTPNASGALKLVGEAYPFRRGGCFALTADNHNSVNGIREFAAFKQAEVVYLPLASSEMRLDETRLRAALNSDRWPIDKLLAFPAQSNYSGVKHPLSLVRQAQDLGWDVMLDCAAFAPSSPIDFSEIGPDYASFSFYKMFGYPTGIGCLIARRDKLRKLDRPWFGGGTIQVASVLAHDHFMADGEAAFEDGTVNYLMIPAVRDGLRMIEEVGIDTVSTRVECLTGWLLEQLTSMRHSNGRPMVQVHGPTTTVDRGGTVTITLYDSWGAPHRGARIEELAGEANISVRTGCFCNPGAGETAHALTEDFLMQWFRRPTDIGFQELTAEVRDQTGKEVSSIRLSVGLVTNFDDVWHLMRFLETLRDRTFTELGEPGSEVHLRDTA